MKGDGTLRLGLRRQPNPHWTVQRAVGLVRCLSAITAGTDHDLALKGDGSVVAWGCGAISAGKCSVPEGLSGLIAIAPARTTAWR